jgi:hypothetical protein
VIRTVLVALILGVGGTAAAVPAIAAYTRHDDRDCVNFATQQVAQAFYVAAGGPAHDPYHLDADRDGRACEALPSAKPPVDRAPVLPVKKPVMHPQWIKPTHVANPK